MADPLFTAFNMLGEIPDRLQQVVSRAVRKAAFDIQREAVRNITANRQVDTGFMKSSVYVQTKDTSTYGRGMKEPPNQGDQLPEIPAPAKAASAQVSVAASYAVFQEMGTVHQPARPFLAPAAEAISPTLTVALSNLEPGLLNPLSVDDGSAEGDLFE